MEKLSREQINHKLDLLKQSSMDEDSMTIIRPANAMCYCISFDDYSKANITCELTCELCGAQMQYKKDEYDRINRWVEKLQSVGLEAKAKFYCKDCKKNRTEIWIKTIDDEKWNVTIPSFDYKEYQIAINFLLANECLDTTKEETKRSGTLFHENIRPLSYSGVFSDDVGSRDYFSNLRKKTAVDISLKRVLGIEIKYDTDEIKAMIRAEIMRGDDPLCPSFSMLYDEKDDPSYKGFMRLYMTGFEHNMKMLDAMMKASKKDYFSYRDYTFFAKKVKEKTELLYEEWIWHLNTEGKRDKILNSRSGNRGLQKELEAFLKNNMNLELTREEGEEILK